jgi:hypothetical protein
VKWKGWKARTGNGVTGGDGTSATDWEPERNLGEELFHVRRKGARKGSKPNGLITQFFLDRDGKEGRPFLDPTADLVNGVWDFKTHPHFESWRVENRCPHCNKMERARCAADNDVFVKKHVETCDYRPRPRTGKSATMVENKKRKRLHEDFDHLELDGKPLENVTHFVYLGQWVTAGGNWKHDVDQRCAAASHRFWLMTGIWKSSILLARQKKAIFWAIVQLLIYGCNSWRVTPQVQEKLDRWVAEKMPYISDRDAEDERADPTMDVDMMVRKLRLKWLGEVLRLPEHRVIHQEVCAYAELVSRCCVVDSAHRAAPLCTPPPRCAAQAVAKALSLAGTVNVSEGGRGQQ